jgi:uncharacterized membrane protein
VTEEISNAGTAAPPKRGWMKYLLIASLALNLLIIGVVAGRMMAWRHGYGPRDMGEFGLMRFSHTLSSEQRDTVHDMIKDGRVRAKPLRENVREARKAFVDAIASETFDKATVDAAAQRLSEAEKALRAARLDIFSATASKLTPDERKAYRAWVAEYRKRWIGRHMDRE